MRKAVLMVGLVALVALAISAGPRWAAATETCTATCTGGTLTCTVASGTCSSASGSVTCCGATHTCTAINAYEACESNCNARFVQCNSFCDGKIGPCLVACLNAETMCKRNCGAMPPTSFSC